MEDALTCLLLRKICEGTDNRNLAVEFSLDSGRISRILSGLVYETTSTALILGSDVVVSCTLTGKVQHFFSTLTASLKEPGRPV